VEVSILRKSSEKLLDFTIIRDKIPVFSLDASYMVNDHIGYVKLARFSHTSIDEFERAMSLLRQEGMKDLILDLSGNGGGWLPVAVDLADHFLSGSKEIVRTEGTKVPDRTYSSRRKGLFEEGKLVIMIDRESASASEIVSGAVQDWDRGVIVGRRSYGKGLVQQPFKLMDGSMIRLTVARYYTPTGRLIQKPYEDGFEEYTLDMINRYNRGELSSADSIKFPESQQYRTLNLNRTVYGGGGIMPDYFVPLDTTVYTDYFRQLLRRNILNRFVLDYVDEHREKLLSRYKTFDVYNERFEVSGEQLEGLIEFADENTLAFSEEDWDVSKDRIALLMKSYFARDLYGTAYFYEVFNPSNEVFSKAVEILENPSLHSMKLAKVEL
jgi:carboxyl-terminal processing protease